MLTYSNYSFKSFKLSTLLTQITLIELSYNQIIDDPANLLFNTYLSHKISKKKKYIFLNKIKKFLKKDIIFIYNSKTLNILSKNTNKQFALKDIFFQNLLLKQIIANVLTKVFEIDKKNSILFPNFYITNTKKETCKKLNEVLRKSQLAIYSNNLDVLTKSSLSYFFKIIKKVIFDQRF